ncbi:hypothetical protein ACE1SV_05470 [Streptomyces sennicomposti]
MLTYLTIRQVKHGSAVGIDLEIVHRTPGIAGLHPGPKALGGRADLRMVDAQPASPLRMRDAPGPNRSRDPPQGSHPPWTVPGCNYGLHRMLSLQRR